jgi:hypothetical protein
MGKRLVTVLAVVAFMSGVVLLSLSKAANVPDVITLQSTLWKTHTKSAVVFPHKKHSAEYKIACTECHHVYKDGKNVWKEGDPVKKCEVCHTEPTVVGEMGLPPAKKKLNLKLAFHDDCLKCHRELKMKDRVKYAKIPVTCTQCHPVK